METHRIREVATHLMCTASTISVSTSNLQEVTPTRGVRTADKVTKRCSLVPKVSTRVIATIKIGAIKIVASQIATIKITVAREATMAAIISGRISQNPEQIHWKVS